MPQAACSVYENLNGGCTNSCSRVSPKLENFPSALAIEKYSFKRTDGDHWHERRKSDQIFREHGREIPLGLSLLKFLIFLSAA